MQKAPVGGFTLVEIAIVLVIVGLLAAGVLVGRDLIRAAELRSMYAKRNEFIADARTFQSKYNCLPGDCDHATDFFDTDSQGCPPVDGTSTPNHGVCNGDGDGTLLNNGSGGALRESFEAWRHLAEASLISGTYTSAKDTTNLFTNGAEANFNCPPVGQNTTQCWLWTVDGIELYYNGVNPLAAISQSRGHWPLTPKDAFAMDSKYDDGSPELGTIIALDASSSAYNTPLSPNCSLQQVDGSFVYNIKNAVYADQYDCAIVFDAEKLFTK